MPTTRNEAEEIVSIVNEYLPPAKAKEMACRLRDNVGRKTDNSSLMVTLEMLAMAYGEAPDPGVLQIWKQTYGDRYS